MDVKQFYLSISGNYEEAVSRMMNDAFVKRMIDKFHASNSYNDIISSYENKDFATLFASCHSFKGVVGNLSFTSLFEIASILTEASRSGEVIDLDKEISVLKERYQLFLDSYNKYLL